MSIDLIKIESNMDKVITKLNDNLIKVRTGRANPMMLDNVLVEAYGTMTPIGQVANISVPEASQLMIKPFDPTLISAIEAGINNANIGINPSSDGIVIRLNIPSLTEEIRTNLVKDVKAIAEEHKIGIRNVRQEAMTLIKNNKELTNDDKKTIEEDVQNLTNKYNKLIQEKTTKKEQEVMTI